MQRATTGVAFYGTATKKKLYVAIQNASIIIST
jgi:hypothetical protein